MNEIKHKYLLAGHKFMPEFTNSASGPFTKIKVRIKKSKKQEIQGIFINTN